MLDGIEAGIRAELVSTYHGDRDLTDDDLDCGQCVPHRRSNHA